MINEESKKNYPTSWEIVKLGDFADSEKGKKPKNQQPLQNEEFHLPYIDIEAFEKGIFKSFTDGEKCVICDNSDFLMVWDGSRSGLVGKGLKGALGSTLVRINLPMINNLYGYYYLQSKYLEINTRAKGVGIPHVDPFLLWNYDFPIPPVNEQNRIVDKIETLFSEVDAGIANLTLAKRQLEQYRQSLLKHAFEGKLTAKWREKHGKALPNADELLEQIQIARQDYYDQQMADWEQAVKSWEDQGKEGVKPRKPSKLDSVTDIDNMENLPTLPDGWRFHRLADIAEVGSGMSVSKNRKVDNPIEVNYLRVANVQRGYLDLDEIKTMIIDKFTFGRYELLEGDILFNEGGDRDKLGRGWIWKNEVDNCITQNHVFRASTHIKNIAHSEFISHWGNTFGRDYFERTGKQTTNLASINKTVLSSFPVPYPSIEEQSLIVKLLNEKTSEVDNLVAELELQLKKATLLKNSILHKAFQGKLVPQDPNDPPASELLAQIKAEREAKALAEKQAKQDKATSKSKEKIKSAKTSKKSKKDEQITLPL